VFQSNWFSFSQTAFEDQERGTGGSSSGIVSSTVDHQDGSEDTAYDDDRQRCIIRRIKTEEYSPQSGKQINTEEYCFLSV